MQKKKLIKPAMFDPPGLAANVAVLHVDLRGLREAGELLVGRLSCDDPRLLRAKFAQTHGEAIGVYGMELHEPGPRLVEEDVVTKVPDPLDDRPRIVYRAVISALLDDSDPEWPFSPPRLRVLDEGV